jgi:hypothetical protein
MAPGSVSQRRLAVGVVTSSSVPSEGEGQQVRYVLCMQPVGLVVFWKWGCNEEIVLA